MKNETKLLYCVQTLDDGRPCGSPESWHGEGYGFDHPFRAPDPKVQALAETMPYAD